MKTFSLKAGDIQKKWHVVDAEGLVLGRLASVLANVVRGKHKPEYTPHMDCGDQVIVVNAERVKLTGAKLENKKYYWHTGYPGGIKEQVMKTRLEGAHPERVLLKAVERMIPKGPLGRNQLRNLHVYKGPEHPHVAQNPAVLDVAARNPKNKRSS